MNFSQILTYVTKITKQCLGTKKKQPKEHSNIFDYYQ